eukprot:scaffold193635_cov23-Prasinocladus_malaysianus.AAC.1
MKLQRRCSDPTQTLPLSLVPLFPLLTIVCMPCERLKVGVQIATFGKAPRTLTWSVHIPAEWDSNN